MSSTDAQNQPRRWLRRLGSIPLMGWGLILLLGALPSEATPAFLSPWTTAVQREFYRVGLRAGSQVFPGNRGDSKRRWWAMRVLAWHPDGTHVPIHESPAGLRYDSVRFTVPIKDTLSLKILDFDLVSHLMAARKEDDRQDTLDKLRRSVRSQRLSRFFCFSHEFASADPRESISIEIYDASISYKSGRVKAHRQTALMYSCRGDRPVADYPEPSASPDWPGVTWE